MYLGRLDCVKNVKRIIFDLKLVLEGYSGFILDIYGSGSEEALLKNLVIDSKLSHFVYFRGQISNSNVANAYINNDVFLITSYHEAWELVVNEAMIMGTIVVASANIGSVTDLITHNQTGFVFDLSNKDGLICIPKQLLNRNHDYISIASNACENIFNNGWYISGAIKDYSSWVNSIGKK